MMQAGDIVYLKDHRGGFDTAIIESDDIGGRIVGYCDEYRRAGCIGWMPENESIYNSTLRVTPLNGSEVSREYPFVVSDNDMNVTASATIGGVIIPVVELPTIVLLCVGIVGLVVLCRRR